MTAILTEPFLKKLKTLSFITKKYMVSRREGRKISRRTGGSIEFADYRKYSSGDEFRYVDWNIYGRSEKLFVKEFCREEELLVYFIIDQSMSMSIGEPPKFFYAQQLAAALSFIGLTTDSRVKIAYFHDSQLNVSPDFFGGRAIYKVLETLEKSAPAGTTRIADTLSRFLRTARQKGLVVIISDLLDEIDSHKQIAELAVRGFDAAIIHTLAPEELNPAISGQVRLYDIETNQMKQIYITEKELDMYRKEMEGLCEKWRQFCLRHHTRYYQAVTNESVEAFTIRFLRQGGLVRQH